MTQTIKSDLTPGIGEFIKGADSKGSKKKFKDTKRIDDDDEDDYKAALTHSVYPQCSGNKAHVCRFSNEQISECKIIGPSSFSPNIDNELYQSLKP